MVYNGCLNGMPWLPKCHYSSSLRSCCIYSIGEFMYLFVFAWFIYVFFFLNCIVCILFLILNKCLSFGWFLAILANLVVRVFLLVSKVWRFQWVNACLYDMLEIITVKCNGNKVLKYVSSLDFFF